MMLPFGFLAIASVGVIAAVGPSGTLFVGNQAISPNGLSRSAVLAGATSNSLQFPGPLIVGNKGDTFSLNVVNHLTDRSMYTSTSIHWHGFFQNGTSWADGPAGVTQCPISSGHSFIYRFPSGQQAGTYWYHSHHETQYCDGLRGPFVVYDPDDPHRSRYDVDDESTVITLSDWYQTPGPPPPGPPPVSIATLINGLGRTPNGPQSSLASINVTYGKRYRFRLVSMSCDPNYLFSIDNHPLTIIEVDGVNTQPLLVDQIQIFAGQRYSFVLNAIQPNGTYWIRATPSTGPTSTNITTGVNAAVFRYINDASSPDMPGYSDTPPINNPLKETSLRPLDNAGGAPGVHQRGAADVNINLKISFANGLFKISDGKSNASFSPPLTAPVLLKISSGANLPQEILPHGDLIELPRNKVIEISIPAQDTGGPHPIHLHGHNFHVVRSAGSDVYNYENPVIRDVVSLGNTKNNDNVTIRFATDNSGPWIMHCHIDFHLIGGLAVVFAEDLADIPASIARPPLFDGLCPIYVKSLPDGPEPKRLQSVPN